MKLLYLRWGSKQIQRNKLGSEWKRPMLRILAKWTSKHTHGVKKRTDCVWWSPTSKTLAPPSQSHTRNLPYTSILVSYHVCIVVFHGTYVWFPECRDPHFFTVLWYWFLGNIMHQKNNLLKIDDLCAIV